MSGPTIPADQWPEWADRHCWDEGGHGMFFGAVNAGWDWKSEYGYSGIPMPAGWDWRVPVMRPTVEESSAVAPAIDLEQFRFHIERSKRYLAVCTDSSGGSSIARELADADRLLALIDGQKAAPRGPDQPDLCDLCRVREEVRSDAEGIPFCQECWDGWQASEQPSKGEGAGHD